jgi:hypothetical protein
LNLLGIGALGFGCITESGKAIFIACAQPSTVAFAASISVLRASTTREARIAAFVFACARPAPVAYAPLSVDLPSRALLHGQRWQYATAVFVEGPALGDSEALYLCTLNLEALPDKVEVVTTISSEQVGNIFSIYPRIPQRRHAICD